MVRKVTPACTKSAEHPNGKAIELYKPGDTRFATNFRMLERTLELKQAIRQVAFSEPYESRCQQRQEACPVAHLVGDSSFWGGMQEWVTLLTPAYLMLREMDTPKPALHMVYESCLEVSVKLAAD